MAVDQLMRSLIVAGDLETDSSREPLRSRRTEEELRAAVETVLQSVDDGEKHVVISQLQTILSTSIRKGHFANKITAKKLLTVLELAKTTYELMGVTYNIERAAMALSPQNLQKTLAMDDRRRDAELREQETELLRQNNLYNEEQKKAKVAQSALDIQLLELERRKRELENTVKQESGYEEKVRQEEEQRYVKNKVKQEYRDRSRMDRAKRHFKTVEEILDAKAMDIGKVHMRCNGVYAEQDKLELDNIEDYYQQILDEWE